MKVKEIKELKIPEYDDFKSTIKYGTSEECYIERSCFNDYFFAVCLEECQYFENSPKGLEKAKQWIEARRRVALYYLGFVEVEE